MCGGECYPKMTLLSYVTVCCSLSWYAVLQNCVGVCLIEVSFL